jgi:uncharacterized alpha-E superfamily protein
MQARPLLSRVANSVYWMSRYIERMENVARFVDVNIQLMLGASDSEEQWRPLVDTSGDSAAFFERYGEATRENVIQFLTFDKQNPNSIISCVMNARENARTVRDTISSEMWEQANKLYLMMLAGPSTAVRDSTHNLFYELKMGSHLFQGITDSTMSHNEAWHFIHMSRMMERADKTTRILDVKYFLLLPNVDDVGSTIDDIQWSAVLRSVSGFEMYRKRYGRIDPKRIVEFLLLDSDFPRSVRHCLVAASHSLHTITGTPLGNFTNRAEQRLGQLRAELNYTSVADIIASGLHEFVDGFQTRLNHVDESFLNTFFAMKPVSEMSQSQSQSR